MRILVIPNKYVAGWDGKPETRIECALYPLRDTATALLSEYDTDAHFAPYFIAGLAQMPRLKTKRVLARIAENQHAVVHFGVGVLDIDCKDAHTEGGEASLQWREQIEQRIASLEQAHGVRFAVYHTRGGCRVLWQLPQPVEAPQYVQMLTYARVEAEKHGIIADKLTDWQRLYRLPYVNRDKHGEQRYPSRLLDQLPVWSPPAPQGAEAWAVWEGMPDDERFVLPEVIPSGERHNTLVRYVASMHARKLDADEIERSLRAACEHNCQPPLEDEDEILNILDWREQLPDPDDEQPRRDAFGAADAVALQGDTGQPPPPLVAQAAAEPQRMVPIVLPRRDDMEIAKWFTRAWPRLLCSGNGEVWEYMEDKGVWRPLNEIDYWRMLVVLSDWGFYQGERGDLPLTINRRVAEGVRHCLFQTTRVPGWMEGNEFSGIAFRNGFLKVSAEGLAQLVPHHPNNQARTAKDFDYDPNPQCPQFLQMMMEICSNDHEKVRAILEFVGVCLLGQAPRMQKVLVLYGTGGNGKSQVVFIIERMFEPNEVISVAPQELGDEYRRAMFLNANVNIVSEVPSGKMWSRSAAAFKACVTGDPWTGRHIHQAPVSFRPRAGHIMSLNDWFDSEDKSNGMFRRWLPVVLNAQFAGPKDVKDIGKAVYEAEGPQIFNLFIQHGIAALARGSYTTPESSKEALTEWQMDQDPVARWLDEHTERTRSPLQGTLASVLHQSYLTWADAKEEEKLSSNAFGRDLRRLKYSKTRSNQGILWNARFKDAPS